MHDEYRRFHVLSPQTGKATWISTDPTRLDLSYWDVQHIGKTNSDSTGQAAFARVLGSTHDFMDIHAVDKSLANGNRGSVPNSAKPQEQASPININSLYLAQHKAYAVIYEKKGLNPGVLGVSGVVGMVGGKNQLGTVYARRSGLLDFYLRYSIYAFALRLRTEYRGPIACFRPQAIPFRTPPSRKRRRHPEWHRRVGRTACARRRTPRKLPGLASWNCPFRHRKAGSWIGPWTSDSYKEMGHGHGPTATRTHFA